MVAGVVVVAGVVNVADVVAVIVVVPVVKVVVVVVIVVDALVGVVDVALVGVVAVAVVVVVVVVAAVVVAAPVVVAVVVAAPVVVAAVGKLVLSHENKANDLGQPCSPWLQNTIGDDSGCSYGYSFKAKIETPVNYNNDQNKYSRSKWKPSKVRIMQKIATSKDSRDSKKQLDHDLSKRQNNDGIRVCSDCHTTTTPLWRSGPQGPKKLCFEDFALSSNMDYLKANSKRSFPRDEEEGAILLMALSCGLACSL
uniref:GATA-type domain-containing protein n=1 Tax=Chenopodium quinoa TaxID=63459 RepID=A0A803LBB0_CHEQI